MRKRSGYKPAFYASRDENGEWKIESYEAREDNHKAVDKAMAIVGSIVVAALLILKLMR